jgi:DNA-binding NtrC family response regulator
MGASTLPVLLVDDEPHVLAGAESVLRKGGITNVLLCEDPRRVEGLVSEQEIGAMVLDLWMPHVRGEEVLAETVASHPEIPVIVVTGYNKIETAVGCMRSGAFDYLVKPPEPSRLLAVVKRALELRELQRDYTVLSEKLLSDELGRPEAFSAIISRSPGMRRILQYVETIAPSPRPVLITGETGTGKELLARAVHDLSGRRGEFVIVNAAGVDDHVFSDTLFGHLKGAYTGAESTRAGLVERAAGGTLFLDEIGDLGESSQIKLLRLLESEEYYPLGSDMPKRSDARLVAATNRDIRELEKGGKFRKDLFFRLRTHHVRIPPLRERKQDIPLLVEYFLGKAANSLGKRKPTPPPELFTLLDTYAFPGNVRELESLLFDAVSTHASKKLSLEPIKGRLYGDAHRTGLDSPGGEDASAQRVIFAEVLPTADEALDLLIQEAMQRSKGNQTVAAQLLGMSRTTLGKRLRRRSQ